MRAFVALSLPDEIIDALARLQDELPIGRPVPEENLHLTLAFLGELDDPMAAHEALTGVSAAPVDLHLSGLDTMGGKHPRVVHIGARGPEALHDAVRRALRSGGIELERRRFRPHITLMRLPHRINSSDERRLARALAELGVVALPPVIIDRFALFGSHLRPDGARYERLAEYPLAG